MRKVFLILGIVSMMIGYPLRAAEWQWSTIISGITSDETNAHPLAFLWIPPNCKQVRGVLIGKHNMIEEGIFENAEFREALEKLDFAEIWITPKIDINWDVTKGTQQAFEMMMTDFAKMSGYKELEFAPIIPIGHSALATFPWNFAAWNPERTLAILSVHGDAPQTNLTGYGDKNLDWGQRTIDGIPGLMVEGEYEWWENRVQPALDYRTKHPDSPVSFLCDTGHGHFDYSDSMIRYLILFLQKAAQYRLPKEMPLNKPTKLIPVKPQNGWLGERWRKDGNERAAAAPYALYQGNRQDAFWYFDKEIAEATEKYYASQRNKKENHIGFEQDGKLLAFNQKAHYRINAHFEPEADGLTFHLKGVYTDTLRSRLSDEHGSGKIRISRICGPVEIVNDTTFTVRFYRMGFNNPRRTGDIWLLGMNNGNKSYKSSVQQLYLRIPLQNQQGKEQKITFDSIPDVKKNIKRLRLNATSDSGLPVYFYVKEGPAELNNDQLFFTKIPLRAKYPIKVTVVAWQYGRNIEPQIRTATSIERVFYINK